MADRVGAGRIDVHHHFYPPAYREKMEGYARMPAVRDWTLQRTLEELDKNGVDTANREHAGHRLVWLPLAATEC